jgi:Mor family transcriptional regulator
MIDPERHELPEIVTTTLMLLRDAFEKVGATDPMLAARQLTGQILRHWGGLQAYVTPVESSVTPRICTEIAIWTTELLGALGMEDEEAATAAEEVAAMFRSHYGGCVLYLPVDRWSFRAELSKMFNGHNVVDCCRRFRITQKELYKYVYEERNAKGNRSKYRAG